VLFLVSELLVLTYYGSDGKVFDDSAVDAECRR